MVLQKRYFQQQKCWESRAFDKANIQGVKLFYYIKGE